MKDSTPEYHFEKEEKSFELKQFISNYLRYWPWFLASLIVCLVCSYLYIRYTPKVYTSMAKIKMLDAQDGAALPDLNMLIGQSKVNLANEIEIIKSYLILEKVVVDLKLTSVFYEEGRVQTSEIDTLPFFYEQIKFYERNQGGSSFEVEVTNEGFEVYNVASETTTLFTDYDTYKIAHELPFQLRAENEQLLEAAKGKQFKIHIKSIKAAVLDIKNSLIIGSIGKRSELLYLSKSGQSAARSERILNGVIRIFNEDGMRDRQLMSERTLDFIEDRFIFLAQELDSIEVGKRDFKQDNNLIYLEADSQISLGNKTQTDEEVFRLENQLALSGLLESALSDKGSKRGLLPANIGLDNTSVNTLIVQYNTAILERDKFISSGGLNNPMVQQLESTINGLRSNLDSSLDSYKAQLQLSIQQLSSRNARFSSEVRQLPEKEKLLRAINRQQQIKESLYLLLLQKREEAAISLAITEPSLKVVEYALSGSTPISPKTKNLYIMAFVLGIGLPFGVLYLIFLLDTKLHGKADIVKIVPTIPVVGEIPHIKDGKNTVFSTPNDRSVLAESFRIFSSNVKFLLPPKEEGKGAVIFTTSSIKGEGKTFISLNLSLALSSLNKKVLLIGADLRNPQLHTYLKTDKDKAGLSNYLHDPEFHWKDSLINGFAEHPGHQVLISGQIPPNPPHLLTNGRFETLLEEARLEYDYIVVDTAPTISVTDTLLISSLADATVYLTRANYTEKNLLNHAMDLSKQKKLKNMAIVINSVGNSKKSGYGYKYGYNYGYGYGYGEES